MGDEPFIKVRRRNLDGTSWGIPRPDDEALISLLGHVVFGTRPDGTLRSLLDSNGRLAVTDTPAIAVATLEAARFMSIGQAITAGHLTMLVVAGEGTAAVASTHIARYTAHGTTESTALSLTLTPAAGTVVILHAAVLVPPDDAGSETHTLAAREAVSGAGLYTTLISVLNGSSKEMDTQRGANARAPRILPHMALRWTTSAAVVAASVGNLYGIVEVIA